MPVQAIPVDEVVAELTKLNEPIAKFHIPHPSKKLHYLARTKSKKRSKSNSKKGGTKKRRGGQIIYYLGNNLKSEGPIKLNIILPPKQLKERGSN